jgi:hypothetical protein
MAAEALLLTIRIRVGDRRRFYFLFPKDFVFENFLRIITIE